MLRWLLWTPLVALTAVFALVGLRYGQSVTALTETDMINAAARAYLGEDQSRSELDCIARPSERMSVWLTVICEDAAGQAHLFEATPLGHIRALPAAQEPQT